MLELHSIITVSLSSSLLSDEQQIEIQRCSEPLQEQKGSKTLIIIVSLTMDQGSQQAFPDVRLLERNWWRVILSAQPVLLCDPMHF